MRFLAIDTATEACSVALLQDGDVIERFENQPRAHARLVLPMVEQVLSEASLALTDLDAMAFGRGPGSFTGVRIGTSVVQGLAFAVDLPVVPVSDLAALAHGAWRETGQKQILTAFDARMNEVYWARYRVQGRGDLTLLGDEQVIAPDEVPALNEDAWIGVGSGFASYQAKLLHALGNKPERLFPELLPRAQDVAVIAAVDFANGAAVPAEQAQPVYLRDKVA